MCCHLAPTVSNSVTFLGWDEVLRLDYKSWNSERELEHGEVCVFSVFGDCSFLAP